MLVCALLYACWSLLARRQYPKVVIYYHAVPTQWLKKFRRHMAYLARRCDVVKPSVIAREFEPVMSSKRSTVAITFDDAFVSVYENARPILRELNLSAGVFVPAGNLGDLPQWEMPDHRSDKNESVMGPEQLRQMDKEGFEIGSHSFSHPKLATLCFKDLQTELSESKRILEDAIGHEIAAVSYPLGSYDERVWKTAGMIGYKLGFTVEPEAVNESSGALLIGRFEVSANESLFKFRLKIMGAYRGRKYLASMKRFLIALIGRLKSSR